jgi:uncharacterized protein
MAFNERGPVYDRNWMVVGANLQPFTQRNHPELALVRPSIREGQLFVESSVGSLAVDLDREGDEEFPVKLWKKTGTGTDQGIAARDYFSEVVGQEARLLRVKQPRQIQPDKCRVDGAPNTIGFADGFPLLLTSVTSLRKLNEGIINSIPMNRFRPNIVVEGAPAYDEDYWRDIRIGCLSTAVTRACARCSIPDVDQYEGVQPMPLYRDVRRELRGTRRGLDHIGGEKPEVFFGQNLVHAYEEGATISVGDPVFVERRDTLPNLTPLPPEYN